MADNDAGKFHKVAEVEHGTLKRIYWNDGETARQIEVPELCGIWQARGFNELSIEDKASFANERGYILIEVLL